MSSSTRAITVSTPGGPEVLTLSTIGLREPGPGELRVRVESAGVNFIDIYQRTGLYPLPTPFTPGMEGCGRVEAAGPDSDGFEVGHRVAWLDVLGSYAEELIVPAARAVRVPKAVSSQDAAAIMLQGATAHYLAHDTFPLRPGHTALVHAAAGGVGLLLCQLAKASGARVIGTVGAADKADLAREAGADEIVLYREVDLVDAVRELSQGAGVDVVYDGVGQATFEAGLDVLRPRGMMVSFGNASGPVPPLSPLTLAQHGSLFLTRPTLAHYVSTTQELRARAGSLLDAVADGSLKVRIGASYPLEAAAQAHNALASRSTSGKLLLTP